VAEQSGELVPGRAAVRRAQRGGKTGICILGFEPAAASRYELDALPHGELAAHDQLKAKEKSQLNFG
jgi:hypothetical protein